MFSLVGSNLFRGVPKYFPVALRHSQARYISTSEKKRDTAVAETKVQEEAVCDTKPKNWISYGYSIDDFEEDRHVTHLIAFFGITVVFCFGGFIMAYRPDDLGRDWAQREAFLELRRREKLGLPLIDPNYLAEDKIIIPTDEELGDTEIIV